MEVPSVVVLLAVLISCVAYGQENRATVSSIFSACASETGAKEVYDDVINKDIIPTTPEGKCLIECILKKFGLHKPEGGYDKDGTKAYFSKLFAAQMVEKPNILDKAMDVTEECNKIDVTGLDHCEAATKLYACSVQKMKERQINYRDIR